MKKTATLLALQLCLATGVASAACCYFAAIDKDVKQPGQRAFISWDEDSKVEAFTVQPQFEGNAEEFGMVIPTPSRPKLQEMPKDFFRALAIFTILEPMDLSKYKSIQYKTRVMEGAAPRNKDKVAVRVLEGGIVGNLDYKILEAEKADALYEWLKRNHYQYAGDESTLRFYVSQHWNFTVMKIDPRQMKKQANGNFLGDITPTRFTFKAKRPIYPLRITQISVKDSTDVLLYVMAHKKMDMAGAWSYEPNFLSMWSSALQWAIPEKLTPQERQWMQTLQKKPVQPNAQGAQLEWAGKLNSSRLEFLSGKRPYNREAPAEDVKKMKILTGHLKQDYFLTKFRKRFAKGEMTHDIELVPARDDIEYVSILPTSPP